MRDDESPTDRQLDTPRCKSPRPLANARVAALAKPPEPKPLVRRQSRVCWVCVGVPNGWRYTVTCRPGHPPRHADFEPGNVHALTHGAHSPRRWRPIAEQLVADAIAASPWLARPAFRFSVEAWAKAEARSYLIDAWLDEQATVSKPGDLDDDGNPRAAAALSDQLTKRAESLRARLGIDPGSMARLLASFAAVPGGEDVLASLRAEGARLVALSDAAGALPRPDDATAHTATGDVP